MVRVSWTYNALENLDDIGSYIEKDSMKYAKIVVKSLFTSTNLLKRHPRLGRMVPEFDNPNIRELIKGSYRIIYRIVDEKHIDVVTVYHSARLLKEIPNFKC
jgi:addiction module RelE/StbE family toxin